MPGESLLIDKYHSRHFPGSSTRIDGVRRIRNSCKPVVGKDKNEFTADVKIVYNAPDRKVAATEPDNPERRWVREIPLCHILGRKTWQGPTVFFQFCWRPEKPVYHKSH